jgi:hypothetical protein
VSVLPALRAALAGVAVALLALPRPARAEDPRAQSRAAFVRGVEEAHRDHFTAARDAFLEAYRLFPHPSILLNLGVARMHTGEYLLAEGDLSRFLTDDGGAVAEDLANARATLQAVRKHIGTIRLRVTPDGARATLDGTPLPLTPGALSEVRAVVGPARLRVEADGFVAVDRPIVVAHDEPLTIDLKLARGGAAARAGHVDDSAPVRHTTLGWSLLGGGAGLAVVGIVAGVEALSLSHDFNTPGAPGYQSSSTKSEGIAWRTTADVLFVTALGMGAAGTYFLVKPLASGGDVRAEVGLASARVSVSF